MLVHFLNNFLTTIAGISASGSGTDAAAALDGVSVAVTFGSLLAAGFLCPLALVIGARLYDKEAVKGKHFVIAGILSALLLIVGITTTLVSSMNGL